MKASFFLLFCGLLCMSVCFSQTDVSAWLTDGEVNGATFKILRIPADQAAPHLKMDILSIQKQLDRCRKSYEAGEEADLRWLQDHLDFIKNRDASFPLTYFTTEAQAYEAYNKVYKAQESARQKEWTQAILDSARVAELAKGFTFINKEFVWLKEKPDAKSRSLGKVYHGSYVQAFNIFDDKNHFIQIEVGPFTGYIQETDIAYSLKELTLTPERREKLESGRYYNFEPTAAYQAELDREEAAEQRALKAANSAPSRKYIEGPKNGCYYINSNGNKQYVDRSFCK